MNLVKIPWNTQAENYLVEALGTDAIAIGNQVKEGQAELLAGFESLIVTRLEIHETGNILAILAAAGKQAGEHMQKLIDLARLNDCRAIRFHTSRKGLTRLLGEFDFQELERVYQLAL